MKFSEMVEKQYGIGILPDDVSYAMAYVPFQAQKAKLFTPDQGFTLGTMYPALNKPFYGSRCGDGND